MKKFLKAAFNITLFQISIIILFGVLKYVLVTFHLTEKIRGPFIVVFSASVVLLVLALIIIGIIEKKGESFETWTEQNKASGKNIFLAAFIAWAQIIPLVLGYLLFAYLIAPTSLTFFIALLAGIIISNSIRFFTDNPVVPEESSNQTSI